MEVLQVQSELDRAVALYEKTNPKRVLEIGCWDGGTLKEWLTHGSPEVVVAVSLEHRMPEQYAGWLQEGTALFVHTGLSQGADMVQAMAETAPYDWAFIDGDHGDAGVSQDVANVLPLMAKGGVMLLHDVTPPEGWDTYGPLNELRKLQAAGYKTEVFDVPERFPWSAGIGVVYV